jgi:hypothetical protein
VQIRGWICYVFKNIKIIGRFFGVIGAFVAQFPE